MPDRHHPVRLAIKNKQNKVQNSGIFLDAKNDHQRTTIYHAIHHNFTTKTPHQNTVFRKNPLKKRLPPRTKKNGPAKSRTASFNF